MYQFSHPTLDVLKLDLPCNSESWLCWSSPSNIKPRIGNDENQSSNSDTKCLCAHFYFLLTTRYVTVGKCQPTCRDCYVQVFAGRAPFSKKKAWQKSVFWPITFYPRNFRNCEYSTTVCPRCFLQQIVVFTISLKPSRNTNEY
jgi:hypothetical protein